MTSRNLEWWELPENEAHQKANECLQAIISAQTGRVEDLMFCLRIYGEDLSRTLGFSHINKGGEEPPLSINIIHSAGETLLSRISRSKPRPLFIPVDGKVTGDWFKDQRKAERRQKFIDGLWYEMDFREDAPMCFKEAMIAGTGAYKVYVDEGKVVGERVPIEEIWVDELDAQYGKPSMLFQRKAVDRNRMLALYPDHEEEILGAPGVYPDKSMPVKRRSMSTVTDQIWVNEAWHLPLSKTTESDSRGGRHVVFLEGATLVDEKWFRPNFPFAFMRFEPRVRGFWGASIVDTLYGFHVEILSLLDMIRKNIRMHGNARVFLDRASRVHESQLDNDVGTITYYTGNPPIISAIAPVSPDVFNYVWQLHQKAKEEIGVSDMSMSAKKPPGIEAAVALRELGDIESERHLPKSLIYENFHMDVAKLCLQAASDLAKANKKLSTTAMETVFGETRAEVVEWSDVDAPDDAYMMQAFPTSNLPRTPAARRQFLAELRADGLITNDTYAANLEIPAVDEVLKMRSAARKVIQKRLEQIVEDQEYYPPEKYYNLQMCLDMGKDAYMLAQAHLPSEEEDKKSQRVLSLLRKWIEHTEQRLKELAGPPGPPPGAPPGGPPPMGPMRPPGAPPGPPMPPPGPPGPPGPPMPPGAPPGPGKPM